MNRYFRTLQCALTLLAITLMCAGASTTALAQSKEVITFAAVTFSEAGRGDRLKAWVDKFNKSQNAVEVQPVALPFASFAKTIFTQMGGGAGPDLVRFDQIDFYAAIAANRILQLDEFIKDSDYKFTAPDRYMKVDGKRYATPFEISNYVLLYNPTLVKDKKAPANFDEFVATAKAATANGVFGFAYRATMAEAPGFWQDLCNFVYGFGGRWSDEQGNLTLNSPKVIEGVTAYKKMYDAAVTPKGTDAATYRRMFWEGKLAMEIDNGGVAGIFNQQAPDLPLAAAPSPFPTRAQGLCWHRSRSTPIPSTRLRRSPFTNGCCNRKTRKICRTCWEPATSPPSLRVRRKIWPSGPGSRSTTSRPPTAFRSSFRGRRSRPPKSCRSFSSRC